MPEQNQQAPSGETPPEAANENEPQTPLSYDAWLEQQPDEVKALLDNHTKGLKSALTSEREARSRLEKDLRDAAKKAEKGSETEQQLTRLADEAAEADRRATFYEDAHRLGVTNLKLAYLVAVQDEMFDRQGRVNWQALKESYPELFGGAHKPPAGNAGAGTQTPPKSGGMNEFIRRSAGRSP